MSADTLLSRLNRVVRRNDYQWMARCPAHDDDDPSLSIREMDDGRLLVHCFGGCSAAEVMASVGLSMSDLFPDGGRGHYRRQAIRPHDALRLIRHRIDVVAMAAETMSSGGALSDSDMQSLRDAHSDIHLILSECAT